MDLKVLKDEEVIRLYSESIKELKKRNIIRTKNVHGELGKYLTINFYNSHPGLWYLQFHTVCAKLNSSRGICLLSY